MPKDAISRMCSMTKAVTDVAAMILYERGHFALYNPISNYLPEFKNMKVAVDGKLEDAKNEITVRDLFMQTAGLSYSGAKAPHGEPYYAKTKVNEAKTLEEGIKRIAEAPLVQHPGTTWQYGYATDVLARYVEAVSGMSVDECSHKNIFRTPGMGDPGYDAPEKMWGRFTTRYALDKGKKTIHRSTAVDQDNYKHPPTRFGGAADLVSTTIDYARFTQMLADHGTLDGHRILSRKSVEMVRSNHMPLDMPRVARTRC